MRSLHWRELANPRLDIMNLVSDAIAQMEVLGRVSLPNLRNTDTLFVASDYGGFHGGAGAEIYSFLIVDSESLELLKRLSREMRGSMPDPRRTLAYKRLGDGMV